MSNNARASVRSRQCIAMMVNDAFIEGAVTFLYSLREHNPWLEADLVVFHSRNWLSLSEHSRALIDAVYPNPRFIEVDEDAYENIDFGPAEEHFNALAAGRQHCGKIMYVKFQVFGLAEYDRVVYFDSDVLCNGDVRPLFETDAALLGCRRGIVWDDTMKDVVASGDHSFNAGVLSIGQAHLGPHMLPALLEAGAEGHWMGDQGALYRHFEGQPVHYVDARYNANADHFTRWHTGAIQQLDDASIIHITRKKPWEKAAHEKDPCDHFWDEVRERCEATLRERCGRGFPARMQADGGVAVGFRAIVDPGVKKIGWAAGGAYQLVSRLYPLDLAYLVDGNETLWGTEIDGVPVRSPDALADEDPASCLVVIYSGMGRSIRSALAKKGPFRSLSAATLLELPALPTHASTSPSYPLAQRAIEKAFAMSVLSLRENERFAIYGAGDLGRIVLAMCRTRGLEPVVIVDDIDCETELDGVTVRPAAEGIRDAAPETILFARLDRRPSMRTNRPSSVESSAVERDSTRPRFAPSPG